MSLDHLPSNIEQGVQSYAEALQITHDEALLAIIETGLAVITRPQGSTYEGEEARIQALLGEPLSDEDAALMDEVVQAAMEARKQRWERWSRA